MLEESSDIGNIKAGSFEKVGFWVSRVVKRWFFLGCGRMNQRKGRPIYSWGGSNEQ
jgi:hypothetical protein